MKKLREEERQQLMDRWKKHIKHLSYIEWVECLAYEELVGK